MDSTIIFHNFTSYLLTFSPYVYVLILRLAEDTQWMKAIRSCIK